MAGPTRLAVEEEFAAEMARRRDQLSCLDAEAEISWRSLLRSGLLPGYLQLLRPGSLKFVGTDPLGRPLLALVVADADFRLLLVAEAKVYQGPLTAASFRRYLPGGVEPETLPDALFEWLSAGLPLAPDIVAVNRGVGAVDVPVGEGADSAVPEESGYWLELAEPRFARLHYLPKTAHLPGRVGRIQLFERRGGSPTEIVYDRYQLLTVAEADEPLALPRRIELRSPRHQGISLTINLSEISTSCPLTPDFQLPVPRHFTIETVE